MDSAAPDLDVLLAEAGWVRALAHSLVRDPAAADDVVQQTWLAALRRPPDTTRPVRPWLGRVVENFARMRARGEAGRERREENAARPESLASTEELCARVETQRLLAQEVLALAEPFRSTIVLRYYEGLSAAEIARRVGAPSATVRWRLMRGLELLRGRLDARHGGDREVWSALLAPLAATAVTKTALKSATGLGVVVARLAMLLALLLGLGWLWRSAARRDAGETDPARPLAAALDRPQSTDPQADPRLAVRAPIPSRDGPVTRASGTRVVARIVDDELRPLAGARLVVLSTDGSATADADGTVELSVASERRELLAFEGRADGHVAARVDAHLAREGDTYLGDIVLARAGALEGFVGDDLGRPIAGARVRAEVIGSRWKGVSTPPLEEARYVESLHADAPLALTGADGSYRFDALPRSFVRVWASADGYTTEWSEDVSIAVAQTTQAPRFALRQPPPEQRLAGIVLDPSGAPVPNAELECARVSLQNAFFRGERGAIRARADERGRFDFGVDPQSHYDLAARDPAGAFAPSIVAALSPGARDVVVALAPARELAISARDESGAAIAEFQVEFGAAAGGKLLQGESEQFVAGVGPVPYVAFNLRVGAPGCAATELGPFEPQSAPAQLDVVLKRAGQLRGSVRGPDGAPIVGSRVQLLAIPLGKRARIAPDSVASGEPFALLCDKPGSRAETATDSAGHFALDARVAGNYMARIDAPGFAGELIGPVHLDAATAIEREVVLKLGGALAGRARRRDGGAVAGSIVGISCGDGWIATARVGPGGEFRFEHLAPRAWQVRHVPRENATDDFEPIAAGNRAPSIAAPTWDAQVSDGSASYCEVFVDADPCVLRGRLLFDGEAPGAWRAELASVAEPNLPPFECALDPDGRFEARVGKPGDYRLRLARITRLGPRLDLTTPIKIDGGVNEWSRDLATATLRITSGAASKDASKFLVTASAVIDEIVVRGSATLDENGAVEVTHWPAVTMTLWLDSSGEDLPADSEPVTLELRRGEVRQVELKRPKNAFEGWR